MRKWSIMLLAGCAVLLCSCGKQQVEAETARVTAETVMEQSVESTTAPEIQAVPSSSETSVSAETRAAVTKPPLISAEQFKYQEPPEQREYEDVMSRAVGKVTETEGVYAGSPVVWNTLSDEDYVYFYYRYTGSEDSEMPELADYAIVGDEIELACGIRTGMTVREADEILPGLYPFTWEEGQKDRSYSWNTGSYPEGWCEQFPTILIAQVDDDGEMPLYAGLMVDGTGVIRAIAFCYPTAG